MSSPKPSYRIGFDAVMNGFEGRCHGAVLAAATGLALLTGCENSLGPVDSKRAHQHVAKIIEFGPRPPGSEALGRVGDYIIDELKALGLSPQEQKWQESIDRYGKKTSYDLRNIWVQIPGSDPENGPILLLAAHYDSKLTEDHPVAAQNFEFVGALDAAAACGTLLELARVLTERQARTGPGEDGLGPLTPNLWLAWFDGEECVEFDWTNEKSLLGSTHFAQSMNKDKKRFPNGLGPRMRTMILMDLIGDPNLKIDRDTRSNSRLLDIFGKTAERLGRGDIMYRFDSPMYDDHVPFKNLGVATIDLIDFKWRTPAEWERSEEYYRQRGITRPPVGTYTAWWHSAEDTMKHVSADSLGFVGNLVWHSLADVETTSYKK